MQGTPTCQAIAVALGRQAEESHMPQSLNMALMILVVVPAGGRFAPVPEAVEAPKRRAAAPPTPASLLGGGAV